MLGDRVRALRLARDLTQAQLAELAGVSRQLVGAVEADRHLPRVDAAVRLAAALSTSVEELLAPERRGVTGVLEPPTEGALVRVGRVGDRLVCTPADGSGEGWATADAQVRDGGVHLFDVERPAAVVAGCDPIIGLASRLLEATSGPRVVPVPTSSATAVQVLAGGRSHAVMVHGPPGRLHTAPVPVRAWHVARWQVGLAAPADLPAGWVDDALAGRLAVAQREAGAGSQAAFERARHDDADAARSVDGPRVRGHAQAAWRAATDRIAAVTIEPAARSLGLTFHPLEEHVSQLWVALDTADNAVLRAFTDELTGERVHRRLAAIGGYDLTDTGTQVAA
ncbi:MAG: helix-turn-helix domain-containing protein [Nitriliruptoraceae bacterium]|nr:helix-turn-helix domain-containing protein [Nitriliruptoraceae bacterium]